MLCFVVVRIESLYESADAFACIMMTSSNGNIFRVTGPLCGEFTGHRWIPLTKASDAELWSTSLIHSWINDWVNNREAGDLILHPAHYGVTVRFFGVVSLVLGQLYDYTHSKTKNRKSGEVGFVFWGLFHLRRLALSAISGIYLHPCKTVGYNLSQQSVASIYIHVKQWDIIINPCLTSMAI